MAVRHGRNKQYIVLGEKRSEDELSVSQSSQENFSNMRRKRQKQRAGDSTMVEHSISSTVVGVTDAVPDTAGNYYMHSLSIFTVLLYMKN